MGQGAGGLHAWLRATRTFQRRVGNEPQGQGGRVATVREFLRVGQVDEVYLAISPVVPGSGESWFADLHLARLRFRCVEHVPTQLSTHVVLRRD